MLKKDLKRIIVQISDIHDQLSPRWAEYKRYQEFRKENAPFKEEPNFTNEVGVTMKSSEALDPCELVNSCLNRFVGISMEFFPKDKEDSLFEIINTNPNLKRKVDNLRQIAIHAEESMEKDALKLVFKSIGNNLGNYKVRIEKFADRNLIENEFLNKKTARLKAMVVDFPKWNQKRHPELYQGLVFKYFDNYVSLVDSEIKLLKNYKRHAQEGLKRTNSGRHIYESKENAFSLHRSKSCESLQGLLRDATFSESTSTIQRVKKASKVKDINESLANKTFTFVGAGFPLTGIILHQETGAKINLVDYDKDVVENAKRLLFYCEECGIVQKGSMNVIHANALDLEFIPLENNLHLKGVSDKKFVRTDILDLASAIPSEVTDAVLKNNVHQDVLVRKRNVQGLSKLLYERYDLKHNTPYKVVAEVTTPQNLINLRDTKKIVGVTKSNNVNSCELFERIL